MGNMVEVAVRLKVGAGRYYLGTEYTVRDCINAGLHAEVAELCAEAAEKIRGRKASAPTDAGANS